MLGKYKAVLALLLLIILVPLTLLMTLGLWVPTLAGIWLPLGTRIALDESPRITRKGLIIPDLRYLVGDCHRASQVFRPRRSPVPSAIRTRRSINDVDCERIMASSRHFACLSVTSLPIKRQATISRSS